MPIALPVSKNVLIVCSHFWPSIGGLEVSMGQLSSELVRAGYSVTVMTLMFPGRASDVHNGVRIASVNAPEFSLAIRNAVASGEFGACILIQDPLGNIVWSVEGLDPPPQTSVFIQPIINEDGYARWKDNADFSGRLTAILKAADAALVMTRSGPDTRYMQGAGIEPVYLPNAVSQMAPAGDFRRQFGIPEDRFMILHVANLYWVKNHVGLIDALPDLPASWQLVMIGNLTGAADCVSTVQAKLATRPDILFIPGLPPEWISAAMEACDVAVLASHGEGSPITLLEAMSHSKPWLATPQCGAANDHLGGQICDLKDFKQTLRVLADYPAIRRELGQISYAHWEQCYSWPVVLRGWTDLIEHGQLQREFVPGPELAARMQAAQTTIRQALLLGSQNRQSQASDAVFSGAVEKPAPGRPALGVLMDKRGDPKGGWVAKLAHELGSDFRVQIVYAQEEPDLSCPGIDIVLDFSGRESLPKEWGMSPQRRVRYLDAGAPPDLTPDNAASYIASSQEIVARYAASHDISHGEAGVDFAVYKAEAKADAYRSGPVLFGWVGNVNHNKQEVFDLLIPAMGEDIKVAIAEPGQSPHVMAQFFQSIDVLLILSDAEPHLPLLMQSMACGVFPVSVRGENHSLLIGQEESGQKGLLVERSTEAFRTAMQWCSSNGADVRRAGQQNTVAMALSHSVQAASGAWKEVLWRTLRKAESAPQ
ncbi:glycosyltransferase family 4 protein [Undibacterium sp. TJN25]|uniref:glycosyltransferase family 4 protein n=1 Tax=Undibacterium sp. TJN25 TaxID=3413056 RepID=UPI003BF4488C